MSFNKKPPEDQLSNLLEHYQNGRFSDAEKLAISISQEFPNDNFSWKVLAAIFKLTDTASEAVFAGKKAVERITQVEIGFSIVRVKLNCLFSSKYRLRCCIC
jgi:hypothetical protein